MSEELRVLDIAPYVDPDLLPPDNYIVSSVTAIIRTVNEQGQERMHMLHPHTIDMPKLLGELRYMTKRIEVQLETALRMEMWEAFVDGNDDDA